jgi:radical SAM enzyme (TIGR01210 family)
LELNYPDTASARDKWILTQRSARAVLNPREPNGFFHEDERSADAEIVAVNTILLTNRECPFRCVMCDLWRNTLTESIPIGAIPEQIDFALERLPRGRVVKLYNSGSFFDPKAIPVEDYEAIATRLRGYERVIVECHPALVGEPCLRFRDMLHGRLEVAMGLETAHEGALRKLNKHMTLGQFAAAADFLQHNGIDTRAFILVQPPFIVRKQALYWAERSVEFAFDCSATAATLIPTRGGNGAMEALALEGLFEPPALSVLESAVRSGLRLGRGRVFADLWNVSPATECPSCFDARLERLRMMNLTQKILAAVRCDQCEG